MLLAALLLCRSPAISPYAGLRQSLWEGAKASLTTAGAKLNDLGFSVHLPSFDPSHEFGLQEIEGPIPASVNLTSTFTGDRVQFDLSLHAGGGEIPGGFGMEGSWSTNGVDSERAGKGFISILGTKISASCDYVGNELTKLQGTYSEGGLGLITRIVGEDRKGPIGITLGMAGMTAEFNPQVFIREMSEHGDEYAATIKSTLGPASSAAARELASGLLGPNPERIGGVSMRVNLVDLAYALANAEQPPPDFAEDRVVVSLRSLTEAAKSGQADLGTLTHIDGLVLDAANHDVLLVGTHYAAAPALPVAVLAAAARAEFSSGMEPYISIDPDWRDITRPHHARIGGVPDDLRSSELVRRMLHADYRMKRLALGLDRVDGLRSLPDLLAEQPSGFTPTRFWIAPRPLEPGDVRIGEAGGRRLITFVAAPEIRTEGAMPTPVAASSDDTVVPSDVADVEAVGLTHSYPTIERDHPDAGFAEVRQLLELSTAFAILRRENLDAGETAVLRSVAGLDVPSVDVPSQFDPVMVQYKDKNGRTLALIGGVQTAPQLVASVASPALAGASEGVVEPGTTWLSASPPIVDDGDLPQPLSAPDLGERCMAEASAALARGDVDGADRLARQACALLPSSAQARMALAQVAAVRRDVPTFASAAKDAAELDPSSAEAHYLLATALFTQRTLTGQPIQGFGAFSDADAELDAAFKLQPTLPMGHWLRANMLRTAGERAEAIAELTKAIDEQPDFDAALLDRAQLDYQAKDREGALSDVDRLLTIQPGDAEGRYLRARIELDEHKPAEAADDLEVVCAAHPDIAGFHTDRATALLLAGRPTFAEDEATKAIAVQSAAPSETARAYVIRAKAYRADGLYGTAVQDLRKAAEVDSGGALDHDNLQRQIDACEARMTSPDQWILGGEAKVMDARSSVKLAGQHVRVTVHKEFTECVDDVTVAPGAGAAEIGLVEGKVGSVGWSTPKPAPMFSTFAAKLDGRPVRAAFERSPMPGVQFRVVKVPGHRLKPARLQFTFRVPRQTVVAGADMIQMEEVELAGVTLAVDLGNWAKSRYRTSYEFTFAPDCGAFAAPTRNLRLAPLTSDQMVLFADLKSRHSVIAIGPRPVKLVGRKLLFSNAGPPLDADHMPQSIGVFYRAGATKITIPNPKDFTPNLSFPPLPGASGAGG